jgi:hypothetical protein
MPRHNDNQPFLEGLEGPKELIMRHHYTHCFPSGKSQLYLFEEAILVFSIPANPCLDRWLGCKTWEFSRLWAPDGHKPNLLTQAISYAVKEFKQLKLADALISYADPNVGHCGGIYRAASWVYLGQSEETRAWSDGFNILPRRAFHAGESHSNKAQIEAQGFVQLKLKGKLRFAKGLTKLGCSAVRSREEKNGRGFR